MKKGKTANKNKWEIYEAEKKKIRADCKSSEEYESRLKIVIERLKV